MSTFLTWIGVHPHTSTPAKTRGPAMHITSATTLNHIPLGPMSANPELYTMPTRQLLEATVASKVNYVLDLLEGVPGGSIISRYIKSSYKDDPLRSVFEFGLFLFAVHYFLMAKRKENKSEITKFSPREVDELIAEWEPAPLTDDVSDLERWRLKEYHVKGENSSHIRLVGHDDLDVVVNMSSNDFLNLNPSDRVKAAAREVIETAGVGACGPPNFYGTSDVHVRLEEDLSRFLNTEQAILYGQDFVTAGSVIPAFLKRGDLAVVDSGVNLAIQKALIVSRCDVEWYDHNDIDHLEQILAELEPIVGKQKPLRRRFIITEGLFTYSGDLCKLPEIVALKNKYKYRLFLDESLSIGTVGRCGRGVPEHFDVPRSEIAITIGSLANAFAASGGFCVGVRPMVHHQRINSTAYVFSAALPPYSAKAASEVIHIISENTQSDGSSPVLSSFQKKVVLAHDSLRSALAESKYFEVVTNGTNPIVHLAFKRDFRERLGLPFEYGDSTFINTGKPSKKLNSYNEGYYLECFILQKIIDTLLRQHRVLINRTRIVYEQENLPVVSPHLLLHINDGISAEEIKTTVRGLAQCIEQVCSPLKSTKDLTWLEEESKHY